MFKVVASSLCLAVILSGCESSIQGQPDRLSLSSEETAAINARAAIPPQNERLNEPSRNEIITTRMYLIDQQYTDFENALYREGRGGDFALTVAQIVVGAVGSIVNPASTSQALSGVGGVLAGVGQAYDEELLADRAIQAIITQMQASRAEVRSAILAKLSLTIQQYPLGLALRDLEEYYGAGTLTGGLAALSETAANRLQEAEDSAQAVINRVTVVDSEITSEENVQLSEDLRARINALTDAQVLELVNAPPNMDAYATTDATWKTIYRGWSTNAGQARQLNIARVTVYEMPTADLQLWIDRIADITSGS